MRDWRVEEFFQAFENYFSCRDRQIGDCRQANDTSLSSFESDYKLELAADQFRLAFENMVEPIIEKEKQ